VEKLDNLGCYEVMHSSSPYLIPKRSLVLGVEKPQDIRTKMRINWLIQQKWKGLVRRNLNDGSN
jgi:hypothetical protein